MLNKIVSLCSYQGGFSVQCALFYPPVRVIVFGLDAPPEDIAATLFDSGIDSCRSNKYLIEGYINYC